MKEGGAEYCLKMLVFACLVFSFLPSLSLTQCIYTLPSSPPSTTCARYDLTLLAHYGPYNISANNGVAFEKLYVKVCDVITTDMPDVCVVKKPSPAYKYLHECQILGDIEQGYAYPLDPYDLSKGISIAYSGGEGGTDGYWPTAIIYELHCDTSGISRLPTASYEWPKSTFRVTWQTGYACPQMISSATCARPTPPNGWDGLRFRNYPKWYQSGAKIGILITWGLFSVPAYGNESYWWNLQNGDPDTVLYHNRVFGCSGVQPDKFPCDGPKFSYRDFAPMFKAEHFNPDNWVKLFQAIGAQYVVLSTKYHTGWCNFPSQYYKDWNSVDNGPHLDLTKKLTDSVRKAGMKMGFYHSLNEWYNPLIEEDVKSGCNSTNYVDKVMIPTLKQLVESYEPDLLLSDAVKTGNCSQDSVKYLKTDSFLHWLYNESPVNDSIVTNSNWGVESFGSYYGDNNSNDASTYRKYRWEFPFGIQNDSFGFNYKYQLEDVRNVTEIIWYLMKTVSNNGNFLLNIGPMANGTIHPKFEKVLLNFGKWLGTCGIAVIDTIPWKHQTDSDSNQVWYTANVEWDMVYAVVFTPVMQDGTFRLEMPNASYSTKITLLELEMETNVEYKNLTNGGVELIFILRPQYTPWTIEMSHVT